VNSVRWKRAFQPEPIKHDFSRFAGELCPICQENRLVAALKYPICIRCRQKLGLTENLLKQLKDHRLIIDQETIDWQQQPHPSLTGKLDDVQFKATHVLGGWFIQFIDKIENREFLACLLKQYLDRITPDHTERTKSRQTKIRRYCFFITIGTTVVTAAYLLKKRAERFKKEIQEAEELEKE